MWSIKKMREKYMGGAAPVKPGFQVLSEEAEAAYRNQVWIQDEADVWRVAKTLEHNGDMLKVVTTDSDEPFEVPKVDTHQYDPSHALDLDDASKMNGMHEAPLLNLLKRRHGIDKIYTNVADVLISVNPYKNIPLLYEIPLLQMQDDSEEEYEDSDGEPEEEGKEDRPLALKKKLEKPHVHSVADKAFRYMTAPGVEYAHGKVRCMNQSIIITGESGAGKTEASKYVMRYLITAAQILAGSSEEGEKLDDMAQRIEDVLLESNTVLESFGNAKTLRNDNSSRFGKYIKLQYDPTFQLVGAKTEHFLLEKSRLVRVDADERSYHVFYQLCAGLSKEQRKELHLNGAEDYNSIAQGGCLEIGDEVDDAQEFYSTCDALDTLGFTGEECSSIWRLLAAILHMGNVKFVAEESGSPETAEGVPQANKARMSTGEGVSCGDVAGLMGLEADELQRRVLRRTLISARGSMHDIPLNEVQSKDNLDGLVKHMYGQLFAWIVWKINQCHMENIKGSGDEEERVRSFIGILDIFGFEIMNTNSFEQLCINFANEVLQKQFNHHIFVLEQEEYIAEGLDVASIPFRDNQPIIDLISKKPMGLMPMLEDQVLTGRKAHGANALTDKKLLNLYHQEHYRNNQHPNYEKPRFENDQFILRHFAGSVIYDIQGFLEKNNDSLQYDLKLLMEQSTDSFIKCLVQHENGQFDVDSPAVHEVEEGPEGPVAEVEADLPQPPARSRRSSDSKMANTVTVTSVFRSQLDSLVAQLSATEPHYIKCIKPNNCKAPGGWNSQLVIQQLRYSGVLEVVRIRREAFPTRITFKEFYRRFHQLINGTEDPDLMTLEASRAACQAICEKALDVGDYQMGLSKVFLRDDGLEKLRWALHQHYVQAATTIQAFVRSYQARRRVFREDRAARKIQAAARRFISAAKARRERKALITVRHAAATKIQAAYRGHLARIRAATTRHEQSAATAIQSIARGFLARKNLKKAIWAATVLQGMARANAARKTFCSLKTQDRLRREREGRKATKLQAWARMCLARKQFWRCKRAAVKIQSAWRRHYMRLRYARFREHIIKIQAAARMFQEQREFKDKVASIVRIQALVRRFLARCRYLRARAAIMRIQVAARAYLRNRELMETVQRLFHAAGAGDANAVTRDITFWPELLFVRNRWDDRRSYSTLLHAACSSGTMDMVTLLEPFPEDVFAADRFGNSPMHSAAGAANYDLMKYLARRANMDVEEALVIEAERMAHQRTISLRKISQNVNVFKLARLERARVLKQIGAVRAGGDVASMGDSKHLMSGFLRKRRETDRWLKRWCVLTETSLLYYHKKTDANPSKCIRLHSAMLKKSENVDFAFEIHAPELLDNRNQEGRLYFQASNEQELQAWMVPLRMVVGFYQFRNDKRLQPMEFLDLAGRRNLVCLTNNDGETPLHMAARAHDERATGRHTPAAMLQVVSWLIENGADPNACDSKGQTPVHIAVSCGSLDTAGLLVRSGGDAQVARDDGSRALDLAANNAEVEKLMLEYFHPAERSPLLPPPEKLFGFTYVSFLLEKFTMVSTGELCSPFVTVSVYNSKGKLTEQQQDIVFPAITRPNYLWWAHTWHMQTPLETLDGKSFVVFELRDQGESKKAKTLAWGVYRLDLDNINTHLETIGFYEGPVDPKLKHMVPTEVIMQGEAFLTKGTNASITAPQT
jgi:myosin-5